MNQGMVNTAEALKLIQDTAVAAQTAKVLELPGDGRGDPGKWAAVCRILADRRHHPIFVHCAAGAQRTTTAVMLYRKYAQGRPFQESYPESFDFRHKAEEWELLAFVADHGEEIFAILDSGQISRDDETVPLAHLIDQARTTSAGRADE